MDLRDNLLVTMGARAAYMHDKGAIELPSGVEGEKKLASFVISTVASYMTYSNLRISVNFDEFIEAMLVNEYGVEKKKVEGEDAFDNLSKSVADTLSALKPAINRPDGTADAAHYGLYKCMQYIERQIQELDKRTRC